MHLISRTEPYRIRLWAGKQSLILLFCYRRYLTRAVELRRQRNGFTVVGGIDSWQVVCR